MNITVFSRPGCAPCSKVKTWLSNKNVEYIEVDVTQDSTGLDELTSMGYSSVPVIKAGDQHWSGINLERMKELVK